MEIGGEATAGAAEGLDRKSLVLTVLTMVVSIPALVGS